MCHVVQLRERLDSRVSRADEHEPELGRVVGMDRRALELEQDAVAERDRVSEVLEADPVLREPGHGNVRVVAPSAMTSRSYPISIGPASDSTATDLARRDRGS